MSTASPASAHAARRLAWPLGAAALQTLTLGVGCASPDRCHEQQLDAILSPRLAIVLSDYSSTAIAIVEEDGALRAPWLDSGSRPPAIVAALSGDVVLPRILVEPGSLVLIDRYQTDVLTRVPFADPLGGLWQADLRGAREAGTTPNPQDVVALEDGRWLVSRLNPSDDPGAPALALGNDLAVLDPARRQIVDRLELAADVEVEGVHYFARPAELARLEEPASLGGRARVLVGLARLSSLALRRTGPGAVALVDPDTREVDVLALEGLSNCTSVAAVPEAPSLAFVLCRGDAFGEDESRAGLALVRMREGSLEVVEQRVSALDPALPPPGNGLVALDARRAAYVSPGSFLEGRLDRLVVLDLDGGAVVLADSAPVPFSLGDGALDAVTSELLVPDANAHAVRRFELAHALREGVPIDLSDGCLRLPPRQVVVVR